MSSAGHLSELDLLRSQVADLSRQLAERDRLAQDSREQSEKLRAIVEGTAVETGEEFFAALVTRLTTVLNVRYAVIGEVQESPIKKIHTLAVSAGGVLIDNFEYPLSHTPCANALTQTCVCVDRDVQATFPQFQRLADLGVESYCAVPIRMKSEPALGLLVVMDTKPLEHSDSLQSLLGVFAPRVEAEFERRRVEQERIQALADLQNVMGTIPDILFILNTQGNLVKWNQRLRDVTGYSSEELLNKPALAFVSPEDQPRAAIAIQRTFTEGCAELEGHLLTKDRHLIPYHWTGAILKNCHGESIGIVGIGRDVVEKKRVEAAFRASEERYRALYDETPTMYFTLATDGTVRSVNRFGAEQLGYQAEELIGHSVLRVFHEQDKETVAANLAECLATPETTRHWEFRKVRKDGSLIWVQETARMAQSGAGETVVLVTCEDVTERKQAEQELKFFRTLLDHVDDSIEIIDPQDGRFLDGNAKAASNLGYTRDELLGLTVPDIDPLVTGPIFSGLIQGLRDVPAPLVLDSIHRRKDGTTFPVEVSAQLIRLDKEYLVAIVRDITERKQAEEALRLTQFSMDRAADAVYWIDPQAKILDVNEAASLMLGYSKDELRAMTVHDLNPDFQAGMWPQFWADSQRCGAMVLDTVHRAKSGRLIPVEVSVNSLSYGGKEYHCALVRDISERKRAEEALRASEERYRSLVNNAPIGIFVNEGGRFAYANREFQRIVNAQSAEQLLGMPVLDRIAPEFHVMVEDRTHQLEEKGQLAPSRDEQYVRLDGSRVDVAVTAIPTSLSGTNVMQVLVLDITERKRAEEALAQLNATLEQQVHDRTEALRASEERLKQAVEVADLGIFEQDHLIDKSDYSPRLPAMFGWDSGLQISQHEILESVFPLDREGLATAISHAHDPAGDGSVAHEFRVVWPDGSIHWLSIRSQTWFAGEGSDRRPSRTLGAVCNITERKRAEEALAQVNVVLEKEVANRTRDLFQSEQAIRALHEATEAPGLSFDERMQAVLEVGCRRFSLPIGMLTRVVDEKLEFTHVYAPGTSFTAGMAVPLRVANPMCFEQAGASVCQHHLEYKALGLECYLWNQMTGRDRVYGTVCFVDQAPRLNAFTQADKDFLQLMARWISGELDRRTAEQALKQSEERYHVLYDETPTMYFTLATDGTVLSVNQFGAEQLGYRVEELVGHSVLSIFYDEDKETVAASLSECLTTPETTRHWEFRKVRKDGVIIWVRETVHVGRSSSGETVALVTCEDITERKRVEEELRKSHAFIRQIIDTDPNFIFAKDRAGRFTLVNKAVANVYGTTVENLIGKTDADFNVNEEEVAFFRQKNLEVMDSHQDLFIPEETVTDSTGRTRWLQTVKRPILDEQGRAIMVLGAATDITERKRMEEALRQRERDLQAALQERERISQDLHDGILQSLFAVGLTLETAKSMMAPRARKTSGPPLDQAIKQLNLVMREIRNFIAGLGSDLLQGKDLPTALQHMLASLTENQVTHVRLAVEDRAAKAVSTEQSLHLLRVIQEAVSNCIRHGRAREARVSLKMLKQGVRLSIRDNGRGFNPTTAKGGGHGLRNMAARAQKMGGRLTVLSKMNEGTRVVLDLPKEASNVPC